MQVCEPLEEITYFDEAKLLVVDHEAGLEVVPEERYAGEPALFPGGRLLAVRERVYPRAASDRAGSDCLAALLAVDRVYQPLERDLRFPGVAKEHATTLDFTGRVPAPPAGQKLWLLIDGWLEYGYSNTFFAAWQAKVPSVPPALELPDGAGGLTVVVPNLGCPAGLPKSMAFDVTGIVTPKSPVFRIRSNYEVYYDRVTLAVDEGPQALRVTELAPSVADLHDRGYPREFSPDGRLPLVYDYAIMDPGYPFKRFAGSFTRFGDVTPLLKAADDRYVVFGHGEELTLRFRVADLPPPAAGQARGLPPALDGLVQGHGPVHGLPRHRVAAAFPRHVGLPLRRRGGVPPWEPGLAFGVEHAAGAAPLTF